MIEKKTWAEFKDAKLLWWVNRSLHLFGWAIVLTVEDDGSVSDVYPARVKFRGFGEKQEEAGFIGLTEYLKTNVEALDKECKE
jgi:hypothetical protein